MWFDVLLKAYLILGVAGVCALLYALMARFDTLLQVQMVQLEKLDLIEQLLRHPPVV